MRPSACTINSSSAKPGRAGRVPSPPRCESFPARRERSCETASLRAASSLSQEGPVWTVPTVPTELTGNGQARGGLPAIWLSISLRSHCRQATTSRLGGSVRRKPRRAPRADSVRSSANISNTDGIAASANRLRSIKRSPRLTASQIARLTGSRMGASLPFTCSASGASLATTCRASGLAPSP